MQSAIFEVATIIFAAFFRRLPTNLEGCHALQLAIFNIARQPGRLRRTAVLVQRCTKTHHQLYAWSFAERRPSSARESSGSKAAKQFGRLPGFCSWAIFRSLNTDTIPLPLRGRSPLFARGLPNCRIQTRAFGPVGHARCRGAPCSNVRAARRQRVNAVPDAEPFSSTGCGDSCLSG